ncbi:MAG: hypothetical protein IIB27_08115, partial [Chloroflexi bacterium]|nr:hypothetical protein [Chloroflexota bacterium]
GCDDEAVGTRTDEPGVGGLDWTQIGGDLRGEISQVVLASALNGWGIDRLREVIDEELKAAAERALQVGAAVG